jgi:hypothetical protein
MPKKLLKWVALSFVLLTSVSEAQGHAPFVPGVHIFPAHHAIRLTSALLQGTGSGSSRALQLQTKTLTQNGFNLGLSNLASATIAKGTLNGQTFFNNGGNNYVQIAGQQSPVLALGSSPLNIPGQMLSPQVPVVTNQLILSGIASPKMVFNHIVNGGSVPIFPLSQARQAELNRLKAITAGAVHAGETFNGGVPTAGQFSGTAYQNLGAGTTYSFPSKFVFAFGNDPLNFLSPPLQNVVINNPQNYISFGKITLNITSGRIFTTIYSPFARVPLLFALGSDPLNIPNPPPTFTAPNLISTLFFAHH